MGRQLDFSRDQRIFDNLEAVTFTSVKTAGNEAVEVADATFDYVSVREAANSGGVYRAGDVSFSIRQSLLAGVGGAKPGDTVTRQSDGLAYTVLTAVPTVMTKIWDVTCRRASIDADRKQLGTLSRPVKGQDAAGRPLRTGYTVVAADVPCRVQPEGGDAADALGKRTMPKRYTAFLEALVDARASDRFVCAGVTYTVLGLRDPEKLGELPSLLLERIDA